MSGGGHDDDDGLVEEHEEHVNHEAWVIPYADMLTLLMALFLMLFAISSVDLQKFEKLAAGAASALGGGGKSQVFDGGPAILEGAGPAPVEGPTREELAEQALLREEARERAIAEEKRTLVAIEDQLRSALPAELRDSVVIRREPRGIVMSIVADQVLFAPGGAGLEPAGWEILRQVVVSIRGLPNQITVEGHTDNVPINTPQFRSNWELSTARATEVLRVLVDELGVPAGRVAAAGYGEQRPVATNDSVEGRARNRRVELAVLSEVPEA